MYFGKMYCALHLNNEDSHTPLILGFSILVLTLLCQLVTKKQSMLTNLLIKVQCSKACCYLKLKAHLINYFLQEQWSSRYI